jgi:hypothetical protein
MRNGPVYNAPQEQNSPHLHVEFFADAVKLEGRSIEQGRPIFEDREFIRIRWVGNNKQVLVAPANGKSLRDPQTNEWLTYKDRFPKHYEAFQKGAHFHGSGTPLTEMTSLSAADRANLNAWMIFTIEALSVIDGDIIKQNPTMARWKKEAEVYLSKAGDNAAYTRLAAENEALAASLEAMRAEMRAFMAGTAPPPQVEPAVDPLDPPKSVTAPPEFVPDFLKWGEAELVEFLTSRNIKLDPKAGKRKLVDTVADIYRSEMAA